MNKPMLLLIFSETVYSRSLARSLNLIPPSECGAPGCTERH